MLNSKIHIPLDFKSMETYNTAFLLMIEACQNYNFALEPEHIKTDFELPLMQSFYHSTTSPKLYTIILKGWHSKVKKIAGKNHLNIFEIVELLKKEQASTEVEIRQLIA